MRRERSYYRVNSKLEYFDPREYDLAGRIAKLRTLHGVIETPYLFPVVDPRRQQPPLHELEKLGFNAFITNAYLFYRRNKGKPIDIHEALKWHHPIMTDSGGYQVLVYGDVEVDNQTIVNYEKKIGVDIGVILDIPTGTKMTWEEARDALQTTFKRAVEALPWIMDSKQLWVLPIQGAPYKDLVVYSSIRSWRYPYHIHAFGSPTVFLEKYDYDRVIDLVATAKLFLPPHKPLHVFGVGHPMIIPFLVAIGGDLFDSASYILYARDGRYMTETGTKRLDELSYLPCSCPVCSKYTASELRALPYNKRVELLSLHNLYILRKEINNTKQAIKEGRLWEYLEYKSKAHPSLRKAFEIVKKYIMLMNKYNPISKSGISAMFFIDSDSLSNPRLVKTKEITHNYVLARHRGKEIILFPAIKKPYNMMNLPDKNILLYHPYLGIFPPELSNTYPYFQHEEAIILGDIRKYSQHLIKDIRRIAPRSIVIYYVEDTWSEPLAREICKELGETCTITPYTETRERDSIGK